MYGELTFAKKTFAEYKKVYEEESIPDKFVDNPGYSRD
jgi:hypothetical protein